MNLSPKVVAILALFAAGFAAWRLLTPSAEQALRQQAVHHREIAARMLGESLARQLPGRQALVIANPFARQPGAPDEVIRFEQAALSGLQHGWRDRIQLLAVTTPELRPEALTHPESVPMDPHTKTPLSFLQTAHAWDVLAQQHPQADLFVSLIGVPANLLALRIWQQPRPSLALLLPDLRPLGPADAVISAFASGKLAAVILARPGAPPSSAAPEKDDWAEFDRRFLLVTAENVAAVHQAYPGLF